MKILYLFNKVRDGVIDAIYRHEDHDNHFFGMLRLPQYGIEADYLEIEKKFSKKTAAFLRKHFLSIHFAHLPLLPLFRQFDVVFTSTSFGTLLVKVLLGIKKPKWVIFDYGLSGQIKNRHTFRQKVLHYMVSHIEGIVTISKGEEIAMRELFPDKKDRIQFIPLGTDIDFFTPQKLEDNEEFIMSVGRDPGRDFKTLFNAVREIPITLKVTAKPMFLEKYKPLPAQVVSCNFTPVELREEYKKAAIVIIPLLPRHDNDSMGCSTLVEAMAMGKAIIATNTSTMASYITNGVNGVLVPEGNTESLQHAIEDLLKNKEKRERLGNEARRFAVDYCAANTFAKTLADYFRKIS